MLKMHSPVKIGLPKYLNWPVNIVQTLNLFTTITISLTWDTDKILALIKPAVDAGVVDGLGMQSHSLYSPKVWSAQGNKDKLDKIGALGTDLYISEYDIEATNDPDAAGLYEDALPVFWNHPKVKGITIWGYVVGKTWRTGTGLIQENGTERPAMTWLMNYLKEERAK